MPRMLSLHGLIILCLLAATPLPAHAGRITEDDIMNKQVAKEELFKTLDDAQAKFVKAYLDALKEHDIPAQQALLHIDTRVCLERTGRLEEIYAPRKNAISTSMAKIAFLQGSQYKEAGKFPADDLYTFAIGHAWFSDIQRYATLVITRVKENGKYYEIIPCA